MKIHMLLLVIILTSTLTYSQNLPHLQNLKTHNLQGKVKSLEEKLVSQKNKNDIESFIAKFDKNGNLTDKTIFSGNRKNQTLYSYNNQNKTEKITFKAWQKDVLNQDIIVTFRYQNDSVFVNSEIAKGYEKEHKNFIMIYENGLLKKKHSKNKEETEEIIFNYDDHQNLISETKYKNGEFDKEEKFTYEYHYNGNISKKTTQYLNSISEDTFFPNALIKSDEYFTYNYTYDSTGNWITMKTSTKNNKPSSEYQRTIEYYK